MISETLNHMPKQYRTRRAYPTLQAWMDATGTNQQELARLVGIKQPHMCNILRKSRRCSLFIALKLSRITNVPIENIVEWPAEYGEVAR
jgi:antitoxin component HigA of HigAB toxin-antitoxin module